MSHHVQDHHNHSLVGELLCHLPYAIFSLAFGMILLSLLSFFSTTGTSAPAYDQLFHSFHFLHIIFAATGTVVMFRRFSSSVAKAVIIGVISPAFFCMVSDAILPYFAGRLLGVAMEFHICFVSELQNVLPFLFVGIMNGFVMSRNPGSHLVSYSIGSHFAHILVSSLASLMYLVAHGFSQWAEQMGIVFSFLLIAVLIPCTLSDVVVPMIFATGGKHEKHTT